MTPEPRAARRWTRLGVAYFALATALLIWPLYPALGNRIEPRVLGLPFSLVYVLGVIVLNTLVFAGLYWARVIDADEGEGRSEGQNERAGTREGGPRSGEHD